MLNYESMMVNLPEDVLKRKWSGDFQGEIELIDALLDQPMLQILRDRLLLERRMAELYPREFCVPRPKTLEMIRERIPDFADDELTALELKREVEYIYIKGEKYYLRSFLKTLLKVNAEFAARAADFGRYDAGMLDAAIAEAKEKGTLTYRIRLRGTLKLSDAAFAQGAQTRVHLPLPQVCAQQSEIDIKPTGFCSADFESAQQRTAYFEETPLDNRPYCVEYSYNSTVRYVDLLAGTAPCLPVYPDAAAVTADDLSEQQPHIAFTPLLRALAKDLAGDETDPVRVAWRFYEYITTRIRYSFMRSYFLIERHAEFCALNGKGDCGIQAILFIALCRIAGIPARWQSGLEVGPARVGCHDWAQFYVEPYGWVFCDLSRGGMAWRTGAEERWRYYFGNLDPFRMVANSRYQTDFNPPKRCDRADPYDNQEGEVEVGGRGLTSEEFTTEYETLELNRIG